jgi:hypothetical protein
VTPSYQSIQLRRIIGGCVVLLLAAIVLAGCSRQNENSNAGTGGGGHTATSADNSNTGPSSIPGAPSSASEGKPTTWDANATSLSSKDGDTFTLGCAPGGTAHSVWGSDIYTVDSSICTAAVHSGLITYQQGGTVTIELRAGRTVYGASERNGVTTSDFGPYHRSFVFKTPNTESVVREADEQTPVLWNTAPLMVGSENRQDVQIQMSPRW